MLPCRIIYNTKDGKLHLFCRVRVVFGPAIPASELQITDAGHKVTALRHMKRRLKTALEDLLETYEFEGRRAALAQQNQGAAPAAGPAPAVPPVSAVPEEKQQPTA